MKRMVAGFLIGQCAPMNLVVKPLLTFGFRFYLAWVFFKSGLTKVDSNLKVTDTTLYLFEEFNLPYLAPEAAAYLATYAELIIPILLVIGLLSRPAAIALFILNAVATYAFVHAEFHADATGKVVEFLKHPGDWQHILWGTMLAVIIAFGPGKISIDKWISNKLYGRKTNILITIISIAIFSGIGYLLATNFL